MYHGILIQVNGFILTWMFSYKIGVKEIILDHQMKKPPCWSPNFFKPLAAMTIFLTNFNSINVLLITFMEPLLCHCAQFTNIISVLPVRQSQFTALTVADDIGCNYMNILIKRLCLVMLMC